MSAIKNKDAFIYPTLEKFAWLQQQQREKWKSAKSELKRNDKKKLFKDVNKGKKKKKY